VNWKDVLRKGEAWEMEQTYGMSSADIVDMFAEEGLDREEPDWEKLHSTGDWINNQVIDLGRMGNPQLQKLAKEYVSVWIDLDTGEEIAKPDYAKADVPQTQILDLLREQLPKLHKGITEEELNYFLGTYLEGENLYYLTLDIIKPIISTEIWEKF
jgi:hypothetical protein